jgi:hypothetical protein
MESVSVIIAGDTLDFPTTVNAFPATDGWTLKYRMLPLLNGLVDPTGLPIAFTANVVNNEYRVQVGPSITAGWAARDYKWSGWVEKPGASYTVDEGFATVKPDPRVSTDGTDPRSFARRMVAQLEAALTAATSGSTLILEYEINGRRIRYRDGVAVAGALKDYRAEVWREDNAARMAQGAPNARPLRARFVRP